MEAAMRYFRLTNMSYSELKKWSKDPCSRKASLDRRPINRNLYLIKKPVLKWNIRDARNALQTVSFIRRMSRIKAGKRVPGCGISKKAISLKNWGFDMNKK